MQENTHFHPRFITIEGVDGAGKGTQVEPLAQTIRNLGYEVVLTREPGGTHLGEQLRQTILMDKDIHLTPLSETLLLFSARAQHLHEVIEPALARGAFVISDRFTDSSWAYQVGGKNFDHSYMSQLEQITHGHLQPGLTFLFDLPPEVSLQRLAGTGKEADKLEALGASFFTHVRDQYLKRAHAQPERIKIINSIQSKEIVTQKAQEQLQQHLLKHHLLEPVLFKRNKLTF